MTSSLDHEILDHVSHLNALARFLARDRTLADDLVQETLLRALHYSEQFERGTNLKAWLTTILRNSYFNEKRSEARRRRLTQQGVLVQTEMRVAPGNQEAHLELRDFERAFITLPQVQRQAIALVGAKGYSYEEAAELAGCAVGTMKSRVSRARMALQSMLAEDEALDDEAVPTTN
ncbi:MAG TPA: sigma-70 family RNA polymerase sigma factor [Dongiaceae bacterium]|nr:sigma-70 family RNA polymerase sigma factor [Dongiaceae bacterium]